jgi:hypothetical protein
MPKKDIDYSKSVIYKIQHLINQELLYVGSTTNFTKRKASHKERCNNEKEWNKKYNLKIYKMIRDNGGWNNFNCIVIKDFPCLNKNELLFEEDKVMRELNSNMNTLSSILTEEQKKEYTRNKMKEYRNTNFNNCNEKNKVYKSIPNKCECGGSFLNNHKARHFKTKKHLSFDNK